MNFSRLIKPCLLLLICQRVSSSGNLYRQNVIFSEDKNLDNILKEFFIDLKEGYLDNYKPRHIIIIGASANEFEQTQPLIESYPYTICENTERCVQSQKSNPGGFVIVFFKDFSDKAIANNINILSQCIMCKVLFLFNGFNRFKGIWSTVTSAMRNNIRSSRFARRRKNAIELYGDYITTNCSKEIKLVSVWKPGSSLDEIGEWNSQTYGMSGCPVSVSSLTFTPKIIIRETANGSLTIVRGREGKLLLALASKLNFTIKLRYPSAEDQMKYSRKVAISRDIIFGVSEIGIGRLRPTTAPNNTLAISFPYDEECVTWGVPRVMKWSDNVVWVEFSWQVWASIGLVFAVGCMLKYANRSTVTSKNYGEKRLGFVTIFVDTVALHVGNPIMNASSSAAGRFILVAYLYYAMVVTTAYKTSLAAILAAETGISTIVDTEGIIKANLSIGGSLYDYKILKNQENDSEHTSMLLNKFVINNNDTAVWNQLFFGKGWAILGRRSFLNYNRQLVLKSQKSVTFNVLNGCVLAYPTVMYFRTRLLVSHRLNSVIQRLMESGITKHWDVDELDADKLLKQKSVEKYFEKRATYKFRNIFMYYSYFIFVSLFAFVIELLSLRFNWKKQQPAAN